MCCQAFMYSQAFVALITPNVPVVGVIQLYTQPQRPIFNFTPSTHSTVFWSHQGNDKIHSGRSSSTFHARLPPPPKPIHHVYHCWRLPGSPSHRRVQGVKRSKGSFPKWSVNNSQKTIPELRGEQLPSPKHRGPLQAGVPRPGASHRAAAPSFWGGECWTNLAAVTNSWHLGSWSMSS